MGKKVISNDLLTSSYLNSVAFVENPGYSLTNDEKHFLIHHNNPNKGTFVEDNYLGTQFREIGKECRFNKFTLKECRYLDNFRANVEELFGIYAQGISMAANAAVILRLPFGNVDQSADIMSHRNRQNIEYGKNSVNHDRRIGIYYDSEMDLNFKKWFPKYVDDFISGTIKEKNIAEISKIKRATFLANLQQHVLRDCMVQGRFHNGQALAEINVRLNHPKNQLKSHWSNNGSTEMDFITRAGTDETEGKPGQGLKFWNFSCMDLPGNCLATNMDITELLKTGLCADAIYFDPPYGGQSSNYSEIYRFLEEYIYSIPLEEIPHIASYGSKFSKKKDYESHFREMLSFSKHIPVWMFSYNDSSWKDIDYISSIIKEFKNEIKTVVLSNQYRYLYKKKQSRGSHSTEFLIIAR